MKKKPSYFPLYIYTGWFIGILIMGYYNAYITGEYNPLYTLSNHFFFIAQVDSQQKVMFKRRNPAP